MHCSCQRGSACQKWVCEELLKSRALRRHSLEQDIYEVCASWAEDASYVIWHLGLPPLNIAQQLDMGDAVEERLADDKLV